jgi:hypothetical protein
MATFAAGTPQSYGNDYYKNNPWGALPAGPAQQTKQPSPQSQPVFGTQSGGAYSAYKPGNAQPQPSARTVRFDTLQEAQGMQQYLQGLGHTAPAVTARDGGYGFGAPPPPPQGMHYSSYNPGQAQPQQQPSLGTAYNPQQPNPFPFAQQPPLPPFQFQATDFMGNQFNNPGAFTAQQGAMAQALNQQRSQQIGNMFTQGTPMGSLDPFAAYGQGQQMMQGGFQNPFAPQPSMDPMRLNQFSPQPAFQPQQQSFGGQSPWAQQPAVPKTYQQTTWEQVGNQLVERKAGTPMLDSQGRQVYQQAGVDWGQKRGNAFESAMYEQGYVPEQMRGPTALAPMRERAGQMADDYIRQQQTAMYGQPFAQPAREIGKQPQQPARQPSQWMGGHTDQPAWPGGPSRRLPEPLPPPGQAQPGFGGRIGQGGFGTHDFVDTDNDGTDDRYQMGPGQRPSGSPQRPGQAQPVQQPSQGTPYNPGSPYEQYQEHLRGENVRQQRDSLAGRLGFSPGQPISDSELLQRMFDTSVSGRSFLSEPVRNAAVGAGLISAQDAAQLAKEAASRGSGAKMAQEVRNWGQLGADRTINQMRPGVADEKYYAQNGLSALIPQRAAYENFLTSTQGVPQNVARQMAEQQYQFTSREDSVRALQNEIRDLRQRHQVAPYAEQQRLWKELEAKTDQARVAMYGLTAQDRDAEAARRTQEQARQAQQWEEAKRQKERDALAKSVGGFNNTQTLMANRAPVPTYSGAQTPAQLAQRGWLLEQAQRYGSRDDSDQRDARLGHIGKILSASPAEIERMYKATPGGPTLDKRTDKRTLDLYAHQVKGFNAAAGRR